MVKISGGGRDEHQRNGPEKPEGRPPALGLGSGNSRSGNILGRRLDRTLSR
jgi:hypothetical protein